MSAVGIDEIEYLVDDAVIADVGYAETRRDHLCHCDTFRFTQRDVYPADAGGFYPIRNSRDAWRDRKGGGDKALARRAAADRDLKT